MTETHRHTDKKKRTKREHVLYFALCAFIYICSHFGPNPLITFYLFYIQFNSDKVIYIFNTVGDLELSTTSVQKYRSVGDHTGAHPPYCRHRSRWLTPSVILLGSLAPLGTEEPSDVSFSHEYLCEYICKPR